MTDSVTYFLTSNRSPDTLEWIVVTVNNTLFELDDGIIGNLNARRAYLSTTACNVTIFDSEFLLDFWYSIFCIERLLQKENGALKREIIDLKTQNKDQLLLLEEKQAEFDSLKIASSMLGSNEDKRASKLKINALIKEINDCIASLSD